VSSSKTGVFSVFLAGVGLQLFCSPSLGSHLKTVRYSVL